jgi:spermidine synthase
MALSSNTRCNGFWYEEQVTDELLLRMVFKKVLFDSESEYQRVQIVDSAPFGKTLILDDHTQVRLRACRGIL